MQPTVNGFCGGVFGIEISQVTNFGDNIRSARTSSIFIVRNCILRLSWMVLVTVIQRVKGVIRPETSSWLNKELPCFAIGIIKFGKSSIAYLMRFGWRLMRGTIPHLNPLPLRKGEAEQKPDRANGHAKIT